MGRMRGKSTEDEPSTKKPSQKLGKPSVEELLAAKRDGEQPSPPIDAGPPPNMERRQLIFDSLQALLFSSGSSGSFKQGSTGGTYVYSWGAGYNGQLGCKHGRGARKYSKSPMNVVIQAPVRHVSAGGLHSAVVTEDGSLYTWGDGRYCQLGHTQDGFVNQHVNQPVPKLVQALQSRCQIVQVACGHGHTVATTTQGDLMSWGWSKHGQTGLGTTKTKVVFPSKVIMADKSIRFTQVAAGDRHTIALTDQGRVYSFGHAEHGQLGLGSPDSLGHDTQHDVTTPKIMTSIKDQVVTFIDAGSNFSGMITQKNQMMICGFGDWLYHGQSQNFYYEPKLVDVREPLKSFAAGHSHIVALTVKGDVVTWGSGTWGQLGNGIKGNTPNPRCVLEGKRIVHVAAGRYHSFAVTTFGTLYSWGNNDNGQAAQEEQEFALPRVIDSMMGAVVGHVVCGEHHTIALTSVLWSKPSVDVAEWHHGERHEHTLKQKLLSKNVGGIGRKELNLLRQQMASWRKEQSAGKQKSKKEEGKVTKAQMNLIKDPKSISKDAKRKVKDGQATITSGTERHSCESVSSPRHKHGESHKKKEAHKRDDGGEKGATVGEAGTLLSSPASGKRTGKVKRSSLAPRVAGNTLAVHASYTQDTRLLLGNMKQKFQTTSHTLSDEFAGRLFDHNCEQRKVYDNLRFIAKQKELIHKRLKKEVKYLRNDQGASSKESSKFDMDLNQLTMQLDTVTIKSLETAENRKNYEQNMSHLKEEQLERFFFTDNLRKQGAEVAALYRKLEILKRDAVKKQEESEMAVVDFKTDIQTFRDFFEQRLAEYNTIVTMQKEEMSARTEIKSARDIKSNTRQKKLIKKLEEEVDVNDTEVAQINATLDEGTKQLQFFEERYQKIVNATGLSNIDAIIQKFFLKEDVRKDLEAEVKKFSERKKILLVEDNKLKNNLNTLNANTVDTCWRDIDQKEEMCRDSILAMDTANEATASITSKLALFQAGIQNFFSSTLSSIPESFTDGSQNVGLGAECWAVKAFEFAFKEVEKLFDSVEKVVEDRRIGIYVNKPIRPSKKLSIKLEPERAKREGSHGLKTRTEKSKSIRMSSIVQSKKVPKASTVKTRTQKNSSFSTKKKGSGSQTPRTAYKIPSNKRDTKGRRTRH